MFLIFNSFEQTNWPLRSLVMTQFDRPIWFPCPVGLSIVNTWPLWAWFVTHRLQLTIAPSMKDANFSIHSFIFATSSIYKTNVKSALHSFQRQDRVPKIHDSDPLPFGGWFVISVSMTQWLVSWSLTSVFGTNMAIPETKSQGWKVIHTQWGRLAIY